jgi:hypothetical protein
MQYVLGNMLNGGGINPDGLSLDLQFAADKTLTARRGPTPDFTRGSTGTFVGSNGLIQTAAIDIPRFDHDPVTLACKGLLIEEGRTNQITFSENFTDGSWSFFATASAANITSTNPSGGTTTSRLTANSGTDTGRARVKLLSLPSASYAATVSCFVKAGNSDFGLVAMAFNKVGVGGIRSCNANIVFSTGVITKSGTSNADFTVTSTAFPDGWYRITISATSNASLIVEDQVVLSVGLAFNGTGGSGTFAGTETVLAWGAQVEAGSFPTSYIPTTTGSVVRSADVCSITGGGFTGIYNAIEGTFLSNSSQPFITVANAQVYAADNGSDAERFNLRHQTSFTVSQLGGITQSIIDLSDPTANAVSKIAYAYANANYGAARNGTLGAGAPNLAVPTVNRIFIGSKGHNSSEYLNGHIASIRYYRKRLPDAKLQALTV